MRNQVIIGAVLVGVIALAPVTVRADATSSPGKFSAAASQTFVSINASGSSISVQLLKGKNKRLLVVSGTFQTGSTDGDAVLGVSANGVEMEPTGLGGPPSFIESICDPLCALSGTWWLDMDAAETANPGMFSGVPVNVVLTGYKNGTVVTGKLSVTATMLKK